MKSCDWGRVFQTQKTANAVYLRLECAWNFEEKKEASVAGTKRVRSKKAVSTKEKTRGAQRFMCIDAQ